MNTFTFPIKRESGNSVLAKTGKQNKSINKKLEEMDLIINSYPQQIAQYDTERKAIIESCQEYKKTLLNSKKINDTLLDSIKKQKTDIESKMNNLLS